jgi:hypothetical protein
MKNFLERELSGALQVGAFLTPFRDDAAIVLCEQANRLRTADVDAEHRHYPIYYRS